MCELFLTYNSIANKKIIELKKFEFLHFFALFKKNENVKIFLLSLKINL